MTDPDLTRLADLLRDEVALYTRFAHPPGSPHALVAEESGEAFWIVVARAARSLGASASGPGPGPESLHGPIRMLGDS